MGLKVEVYESGIYRLGFPAEYNLLTISPCEIDEENVKNGWVKSEDGDYIKVKDGAELEIQCACACAKADICEAGNWCPGRFRVVKPFKGLFCLVFYTKSHPKGCLSLSLIRSLKCKDGKLLRRMNLNTEQLKIQHVEVSR